MAVCETGSQQDLIGILRKKESGEEMSEEEEGKLSQCVAQKVKRYRNLLMSASAVSRIIAQKYQPAELAEGRAAMGISDNNLPCNHVYSGREVKIIIWHALSYVKFRN